MFSTFRETFRRVLDKNAPLRMKIKNKSKTRNKYIKWPSGENFLVMKRAKNYCNNLTRTTKKNFFQRVTKSGFPNSKKFWNTVKLFLTNKGFLTNDSISVKVDDDLVIGEKN